MSAIAGIYNVDKQPATLEHAELMMKELSKFPANDIRVWRKDNIFLGCHAQWITPESIGEPLPYYDNERQVAITADTIIDNREELFQALQVEKDKRELMPDSQLILLAYCKWGEDTPKHLIGDFAFMIWDEREQKLFGARDPSGYRTLYYYYNHSSFTFCTTIEPILALPNMKKRLNEQWLAEYLANSGTIDTVDARSTPYCNIEQVPPFHSISITEDKIKLTKYGSFFSGEQLKLNSDEEYVEAFQDVFQKAVNSRLRTHHKIGAQLSGGLDSGAVVGFAANSLRKENKRLETFSYVPPNDFKDYTPKQFVANESEYIKSTVNHVGGIKEHILDFNGKDPYTDIDSFTESMEMPYKFFENSFWLKGMFEKAHDQDIGVLLNGDRGNFTISWGSALDYYAVLLKKLKWVRLFQELDYYSTNVGGARLRRIPLIAKIGFPVIQKLASSKRPLQLPRMINSDFAERTEVFHKLESYGMDQSGWFPTTSIFDQRKNIMDRIYPWNAGNTLTCKLSLRYGLWKRDPTNDLRVVRFCLSLPDEQFVQKGFDRALIRRSTENILPDKVRLNQRVRGFQGADCVYRMLPYWDTFIREAKQLISDKRMLEYLDADVLNHAFSEIKHRPSSEYATNLNYKIMMRSLILYRFMNKFS
ncbi:lasso peptide isopeptide bond-forming cyclase [Aquibacillus albus]|uniref:asparagine synthase (glutamine-hydrolyzing) n=1 Tax=Aquibacillus albus TaxID=1168171 RepID=A0ABS2N5W2_9BACI|nr:lasso peptide isopeptide bond-forming cyclase [Aquibacillus albus]MBM7573496.1 asparagine synthase (glutamine-hydrolyzing) [Aquibacillus albus]